MTSPASASASGVSGPQLAQEVQEALRAKARHAPGLMRIEGVLGAGVGLNEDGEAVVKLFTARPGIPGIPDRLDGVPVAVQVTGLFLARPAVRPSPVVAAADAVAIAAAPALTALLAHVDLVAQEPNSTADRWPRPVPPGVSTGHPDITAGTLGARVKDGSGNLYALSNNHVYGNSNAASIGDPIIQPGTFDGGQSPGDDIGTLAGYVPIDFNGGENLMDAAVAGTTDALVGAATPTSFGAYGAPSSEIWGDADEDGVFDDKTALLGLQVEKFGRTTGPTNGTIDAIDVTVNVCYEALWGIFCVKSALFVDQISIVSNDNDPFSAGGDSGSLIVTEDGHSPVGLLFAGSSANTLANRIDLVLDEFGVTVDDGNGDEPPSPVTDIAVQSVSAPSSAVQGDAVSVDVTVANLGDQDVTTDIDVTLTDETDATGIGTQTISGGLAAGGSTTLTYTWDTTGESAGDHTLMASHDVADADASNDSATTTVSLGSAVTDIAMQSVSAPSSAVLGEVVSVDVTVENVGNQDVTTDIGVTLTDDTDVTDIGTQTISGGLAAGGSTTLTYTWDTTGESAGEHTLTAGHDATDDDASNDAGSAVVTLSEPVTSTTVHVGDLDGSSEKRPRGQWRATVTILVHDDGHALVAGATVAGSFEQNGTVFPGQLCTTDAAGRCSLTSQDFANRDGQARFVVAAVAHPSLGYTMSDNHDPDGDSDGTIITVNK